MIIQCENCSRKFFVKDSEISDKGRMVQCGYCSVTWHQMPSTTTIKTEKKTQQLAIKYKKILKLIYLW